MMKRILSRIDRTVLNQVALLGAFSMFLSTIEYLFPRPLPFMRLGLANLPLLLGLEMLSLPSYFLLVVLKVLGQALVNGTLASYVFLFSLSGTLASALIMKLCYSLFRSGISYIGISLMGALASTVVQMFLSVQFVFGQAAWRIMPVFLGAGLLSGLFIGIFAVYFSNLSVWWADFSGRKDTVLQGGQKKSPPGLMSGKPASDIKRKKRKKRRDLLGTFLSPAFRFWTGLSLIPAWLFLDILPVKAGLVVLFGLLAFLSGKKIRFLYFIILISSITFFHLFMPSGRVLAEIGPLRITIGALEAGLEKGITLCGLVMLSLFSVSGSLKLPGRFGGLLARTFYFFEEILEARAKIVPGRVIGTLDSLLIELFPAEKLDSLSVAEIGRQKNSGRKIPSLLYALILSGGLWGCLILQFMYHL